ncbi:MAG TPA: hypothetical protein VFG55_07255 [Rhodanobacteraceae bacterium]|nr:hypothetical protein [Rhodanobacteraceae bacterium]
MKIERSSRLVVSTGATGNLRDAGGRNALQDPVMPTRACRRALKLGPATLGALGLVACLFATSKAFAFQLYTVGGDAACNFADLQQAVDAATDPEGNSILIAQNLDYLNQHVVITGKNINLLGGLAECSSSDYIGQTTIHGTAGYSLIEIGGNSHVYLGNLFITGATTNANQSGGGISFTGQGSLELANTTVSLNSADYGGGINVNGSGGPATLTLDSDTLILNNTAATSGGGIRLEGNTRMYALQPQTWIAFNHAPNGYGGGIEVLGPARADIASPGYNGAAVIDFNDAQYGGGIAALAINVERIDVTVRLFTTDALNPVQIANNSASATGGGVYLKPYEYDGAFSFATLCAFDFRINDNLAQEGSALYVDEDHTIDDSFYVGGDLKLNGPDSCGPESPPALGAVACDPSVPCNEINRNIAQDSSGTPTPGSAILVQDAGTFSANRLLMRGNQGAHAIRTFGGFQSFVHNCLVADNQVTGELVRIDNDYLADTTEFVNCTFANNAIGGDTVIYSGHGLGLADMIIDQPGVPTLAYTGDPAELSVSYVLSNDTSTLPVATGVIQGEPTFVDAANGDYHLLLSSLGVDFAPAVGGTDLDRVPRTVDLPGVPNEYGALDLGAYEIQIDIVLSCANADTIFCDGFEAP